MLLQVGMMVGEYRVEGMVGEGGMGQVYGAVHPVIGKRAAIKVLRRELCTDLEAIERFVMEARAVNQIGHPNIVDVFAFGALPDGRQYMVMEWLRGESLASRIERAPPTLDEAFEILLGIGTALAAAHDKNIVHRDLKPHNIFLVEVRGTRPMIKLLDFGLVKLMGNDDVRIERTRSGNLLGTPAYISPEQARGRGVDHRTDLYALGAIAFQLITGRLVFGEPSAMEMVVAHMHHAPPRPSDYAHGIPPALDALVLGLLAKDAGVRPTLAEAMDTLQMLRPSLAGGAAFDASRPTPMPIHAVSSHPPAPAAMSTISRASGEHAGGAETRSARGGAGTLAFLGIAAVAIATVVFFVVDRGSGDRGEGETPAAGGAVDAAMPAIAPADAASIAMPADAAPAPVDASVMAVSPPDARKRQRDRDHRDRKRPDARPTETVAPPIDDGDGTIKVLPEKTPGAP